MLNQKQLADKVKSYEAFVTNVLQVDLAKASNVKAKLQSELQELQDLEHNLKVLQQARLGFHLEATLEEAPRIIGIRKANVEKKIQAALDQGWPVPYVRIPDTY
eukprot:1161383-Pelagomonas_calceolata.AAC.11